MKKIEFENLPNTKTPLSAENLNIMQDNIEEEINGILNNQFVGATKEATNVDEYVRLFTISLNFIYKTCHMIFQFSDTQAGRYNTLVGLSIHEGSGKNSVEIKHFNCIDFGLNISSNLVAVINADYNVEVYYKFSTAASPTINILSFSKMRKDTNYGELEMDMQTVISELPVGTQVNCTNIEEDTDWIDLPLKSGITVGSIVKKAQYRKTGKIVHIRGDVAGITAANTIIATLPAEYRPTTQKYFINALSGTRYSRIYVAPSGTLALEWTSDGAYNSPWYSIDCSFMID